MSLGLLLLLLLSASAPPAPAPAPAAPAAVGATAPPPLQEAEAALRAGIHKRCIELAQQALQTGQLDVDGVARAWWIRGRCHSIDGDADRAQRSYAVAVRVKPGILMPVDDPAFSRVKTEGTAVETALVLDARTVVVPLEGGSIVAVDVVANDDLGLGKAFVLVDSAGREVARSPIERADDMQIVVKHRTSGIPVEGLRALLLDKHGNRLREADVVVDAAARSAFVAAGASAYGSAQPPPPPSSSLPSWLSYVGAGTAVVGLVGAASSGIALAITTQADDAHVIDSELPWLVGFVSAVGVVVVGGSLIVVDQAAPPGS